MFQKLMKYRLKLRRRILRSSIDVKRERQINFGLINEAISENVPPELLERKNITEEEVFLNIATLQYFVQRFGGYRLTKSILRKYYDNPKLRYFSVPKDWRNILIEFGIQHNEKLSVLAWSVRALFLFFWAYFRAFFFLMKVLYNKIQYKKVILGSNVNIIFNIGNNNLSQDKKSLNDFNIINENTIFQSARRKEQFIIQVRKERGKELSNHCKSILVDDPLELIFSRVSAAKLLLCFLATFKCCNIVQSLNKVQGNILFFELFLSKVIKSNARIFQNYRFYFNNASYIYRPIWTYYLPNPDTQVFLYFYSVNIFQFSKINPDGKRAHFGYKLMSWPNYFVWTAQMKFLLNIWHPNANIKVVGPITNVGRDITFAKELGQRYLAVFDVTPVRKSFYNSLGIEFDYHTYETAKRFLTDIITCAQENNSMVLFKIKRKSNLLHKGYISFLETLSQRLDCFILVDESCAVESLVSQCEACISMPFTSTAHIAAYMGKPSVFYDPTASLENNEPCALGVAIINNKASLSEYLSLNLDV